MAKCPLHEDRHPSLSWRWSDGRLLLFCHSCQNGYEQIRAAL